MARQRRSLWNESSVEGLIAARSAHELDAELLRMTSSLHGVGAVAIWRRVAVGRNAAAWIPVLTRGQAELLPAAGLVRSALEGALDERLPGGAVVVTPLVGERFAAVVFASDPGEAACDATSGWLGLHAALASAQGHDQRSSNPFGPPMPGLPRASDDGASDGSPDERV
ncbi:MAG: hypothetical protein IT454_01230 [Planctomycetes bacterium]|nr:hypothetical protein [Planctomycetota bacterium]